ncbi:hypothetical protein [uncultured Ramlibacter sp.]|uniref:hypothetical protein n=1 Tax=uncultured Ramlibacter sp. TaxID=260755 RepID=UPI00263647BD|nr:hypothetical protein [uncultured Ramlibacter sp.]
MKSLIATLLIAATPVLVLAQAAAPAKPEAKPAAKPVPRKSEKLAPAAQKAVEEVTPIDDDPTIQLSEGDLAVAKRIYVGTIPCELGASVTITPGRRDGMFRVQHGRSRFLMHPVESRTGAFRLEDPRQGAMWLQLGNKSMLMSQKLGQRLADDCMNPAQHAVNEALKKNPINILEPQASGPKATPTGAAAGPN